MPFSEKLRTYFSVARNILPALILFLVISTLLSYTSLFSGYGKFFLYIISVIAFVNIAVILPNNRDKLYHMFLVYASIDIGLGLITLGITKIYVSGIFALVSVLILIYLLICIVAIFVAYITKLLISIIDKLGLFLVIISVLLAYYYPVYTAMLVKNIYSLEETLLISTAISLVGIPIFEKLRKKDYNKLFSQLLTAIVAFLLSLLIITFYMSFVPISSSSAQIIVNINVLQLFTKIKTIQIPLNITALANSLSIVLFLLGIIGVILVIRKLNVVLRDLGKAKRLNKLEVTEAHYKELEECMTKLCNNMNQRLYYIEFDPIYPMPKSSDFKNMLSSNIHWWDNSENLVFSGVNRDTLKDASYHLNKNLEEMSKDFITTLSEFIPRRLNAYCKIYNVLIKKYDPFLLQILFANIIVDDYRVRYNLDIIKQTKGLENKYKRALKSLHKIKEIESYKATEDEFNKLAAKVKVIKELI